MVFANVVRQVVKLHAHILIPFDQFEIPQPHRTARRTALVAVVRVMPEQRPFRELPAFERGHDALAVDMLFRPGRQARNFEKRRIKIGGNDLLVADTARLGDARPPDEQRFADAPLVRPTFASTQGQVRRGRAFGSGEPAVVGSENDDGLLIEAEFTQLVEHAADVFVEAFDHRGICGMVLDLPHLPVVIRDELGTATRQLRCLGLVFGGHPGLGLHGVVHRIMRQIEEKGLVFGVLDKLQRLVGQPVVQVFAGRPVGQVGEAVGAKIRRWMAFPAASNMNIEALVFRPVFGSLPQMPLANGGGFVSGGLKCLGDREFLQREKLPDRGGFEFLVDLRLLPRQPVGEVQARGEFARDDGRASGRADTAGCISVSEPHALPCKPVETGRLIKRAAVTPEVSPAEVIGED